MEITSLIKLRQEPLETQRPMPPEFATLAPDAIKFICDALKKSGAVFSIEGQLVTSEQLPDFLKSKGLSPQQQGAVALYLYSSLKNGTLSLPSFHGSAITVNENIPQLAHPNRIAKFIAGLERAAKQKNPMALLECSQNATKENQFREPHKAYSDPVRFKTALPNTSFPTTRVANLGKLFEGVGIPREIVIGASKEGKALGMKNYA